MIPCPPVEPQNRSSYFILITKTTPKESEGQASSFVSLSDSFRFLIAEIIWIICMIHLSIYIRNIIGKSIYALETYLPFFICSLVLINRSAISETFFRLFSYFCYNGQTHCKLADWTHTVFSVGRSTFISQKYRGAK